MTGKHAWVAIFNGKVLQPHVLQTNAWFIFNAYQFYALCYKIQVQINFWWRLMVSRSYKITSIFDSRDSRLAVDPPSSKPVQISFLTITWRWVTWYHHHMTFFSDHVTVSSIEIRRIWTSSPEIITPTLIYTPNN